ncbi:Modification methylase MboII [Sedimentisphaera cyanobacteriorum]|uniref:site-specific DNA-methyltransferase (adenine-specific) n=1 Tax=Sedimentisphaera cyanobacteriorum TaxID=1940790 RepID=A0A1Q2HR75_9BACT|nr:site-specific DNA-methyltransferase [Sedimentisphaera cyanobacteriorum]AQQ09922.1 Modification methylase MboII [Sedimentisphaera cyanobacteriorum]
MKNLLIKGENLEALELLIKERGLEGSIDLVYIDPPFATGTDFKVSLNRSSTVSSSRTGSLAYSDKVKGSEFIEFLRKRMLLLKELLSERGSIYLHTDCKIGHYVKIMMDEVFGVENFRNDITRIKCNPKNFNRTGFSNIKDMILFYSKGKNPIWNEPREDYSEKDREKLFPKNDSNGRRYTTVPIHAPGETKNGRSSQEFKGIKPPAGRHWRVDVETLESWDKQGLLEWSSSGNPRKIIYADEKEGKRVQDIWEFKDPQYPTYPTEKNSKMLEMIIKTSSIEASTVLDCFCGSGSTLRAAERLNRSWIGIDSSAQAIETSQKNISKDFSANALFDSCSGYEMLDISEQTMV